MLRGSNTLHAHALQCSLAKASCTVHCVLPHHVKGCHHVPDHANTPGSTRTDCHVMLQGGAEAMQDRPVCSRQLSSLSPLQPVEPGLKTRQCCTAPTTSPQMLAALYNRLLGGCAIQGILCARHHCSDKSILTSPSEDTYPGARRQTNRRSHLVRGIV